MRIIKARDYDEVSRKAANIIFSVMTENLQRAGPPL